MSGPRTQSDANVPSDDLAGGSREDGEEVRREVGRQSQVCLRRIDSCFDRLPITPICSMKFRKSLSSPDRLPESTTLDLVLAQDGDPDAFRRVVVATETDVRRFCAWLCQPGFDLDDLVQETYVRAFRGVASFRSESNGLAYP